MLGVGCWLISSVIQCGNFVVISWKSCWNAGATVVVENELVRARMPQLTWFCRTISSSTICAVVADGSRQVATEPHTFKMMFIGSQLSSLRCKAQICYQV